MKQYFYRTSFCPKCGEDKVEVIDSRGSRLIVDRSSIRRRRKCNACGHRWSTYEVHEDLVSYIENSMKMIDKLKKALGVDNGKASHNAVKPV